MLVLLTYNAALAFEGAAIEIVSRGELRNMLSNFIAEWEADYNLESIAEVS